MSLVLWLRPDMSLRVRACTSTYQTVPPALASGEPAKAIPVAAVRLPPIEWLDSFWVRDRLVLTEREGVRSFIIP